MLVLICRCFHTVAKTPISSAISIHLSACISMAPTGQISVKFETGTSVKVYQENPNFVESQTKISDTLHEDIVCFIVAGNIKLP